MSLILRVQESKFLADVSGQPIGSILGIQETKFLADVSGQPIGPILMIQESKKSFLNPEPWE